MNTKVFLFFCSFLFSSFPLLGQQICVGTKITDVLGNEDPLIDCSYPLNVKCLQLTASFPVFNKTNSYAVSAEDFTPYGSFNAGTPLNADADDLFFAKVDLPFNFCYFGDNYNSVIVGTNGVISFNGLQLGKINYPNVEGLNPSTTLPNTSIFGAYSDLVFSKNNDSEIYYRIEGVAPCRKLIINFYKGRILGCEETSTSQIVLSEGSNTIEVFVENKPLPCSSAKFKNSLLGIINEDQTAGYSPAGRNTGVWAAQNEAWKFTPSGAPIIPQISWFNSSNQNVGSGATVSVCPEKNEIYTVKVKYPLCGNFEYTLEDTASVTFAPDYPLAKDFTKILCGNTSFTINLDDYRGELTPQDPDLLNFTFHNSLAEAQSGANPQPRSFVLSSNRTFYVRVQNPADPTCYRTSVLNLTTISNSLLTNTVAICDANNDGIEHNYQLSALNFKLFNAPINGTIHYFLSAADAANNVNEVSTTDITATTQLYVNYQSSTCNQVFGPISLTFLSSPIVNSPITFQFSTCDFKYDLLESFEFEEILGPLVTSETGVVLSFHNTYQEALSGGASIKNIKEGNYQIFVRVQFPGGCFSIATVNMEIEFTEVIARDKSIVICFDGTEDKSVNLDDYSFDMLQQSPIGITMEYFATPLEAQDNVNPISKFQTVTEDGNVVRKAFYVRFTDPTGCYAVKQIEINLVHVIIFENQFEVCDFKNDGSENYTLSNFSSRIKGTQNGSVKYFATQSDADNNTNSLTAFNIQSNTKLFVRIESYGCFNVFEINLSLVPTPVVKTTVNSIRNSVCDNNNDGFEPVDLTALQPEIYSGSDVTFQYYTNYNPANNSLSGLIPDPTAFVSQKTSTVYAKVTFVSGGCYSVSTLNISINFLPAIILKPAILQKCDYDFNLNESFNLPDAYPQLFSQGENSIPFGDLKITYYKTEIEANEGNPATEITSPVVTSRSKLTVWVRFTSKVTGCYSIAPVELQTYLPPKALNSAISDICDENLDGLYDVDLTLYTAGMVFTQSADNKFEFFKTKADADKNTNPIPDPKKFTFDASVTRIWVRVENIPGCFDTASVDFRLGPKVKLGNGGPFSVTNTCDIGNDGKENIDLTQFENVIVNGQANFEYYPTFLDLNNGTNKIGNPKAFLYHENSGPQTIFVKVMKGGFCPEKVEINLQLKKTPMFMLEDYYFCPESFVDIKPDFSGLNIVTFEWLDPSGKVVSTSNQLLGVKISGIYKINVVGSNGCTFSTSFNVKTFELPVITDLVASGNTITVIATGSQKILYSKDGINFGESNVFPNLPFGVTTFYVKFEGSTCLPVKKDGLILDIKNAFSPNADGINDTWIIDDLNVFGGKTANLKVFDRYQVKIFEQNSSTRFEWDGTYSKRVVNTGSYWYLLTLPDGRTFNGWVLLKNRN